ncbi:uncharacterized protein DDB_G0271670-like [Cloeon dipterum]|uniref:uncharacterized protein DDB_G0271670-like n=1 Tax=Cloeon dipterum TaxID=197152 RepID=UPI00321FD5C3
MLFLLLQVLSLIKSEWREYFQLCADSDVRRLAGVHQCNFLFGTQHGNRMNTSNRHNGVLKDLHGALHDASTLRPRYLRTTLATNLGTLNLSHAAKKMLCLLMGHEMNVHDRYYELPTGLGFGLMMGRALELFEGGVENLRKHKGKTLEEAVEMEAPLFEKEPEEPEIDLEVLMEMERPKRSARRGDAPVRGRQMQKVADSGPQEAVQGVGEGIRGKKNSQRKRDSSSSSCSSTVSKNSGLSALLSDLDDMQPHNTTRTKSSRATPSTSKALSGASKKKLVSGRAPPSTSGGLSKQANRKQGKQAAKSCPKKRGAAPKRARKSSSSTSSSSSSSSSSDSETSELQSGPDVMLPVTTTNRRLTRADPSTSKAKNRPATSASLKKQVSGGAPPETSGKVNKQANNNQGGKAGKIAPRVENDNAQEPPVKRKRGRPPKTNVSNPGKV